MGKQYFYVLEMSFRLDLKEIFLCVFRIEKARDLKKVILGS